MKYCNVKPEKISFKYSNVVERNTGVIYAHFRSHNRIGNISHEDILNYYKKNNENDSSRYVRISKISIGDFDKDMNWIEEAIYNFPR